MNIAQSIQIKILLESMQINIANGFSMLEQYTRRTTEFYDEWQIKEQTRLEKEFNNGKVESGYALNRQSDLRIDLQYILFKSTFISCVAFFEFQFKLICEILDPQGTERSTLEKSDSYIIQYYRFLRDVLNINLKPKKQQWDSLCVHSEIRNSFVHAQGTIENPKSDLIKKIPKMKYVRLEKLFEGEDYTEIQITDCQFIYDYINTASDFLYFVVEELLKVIPDPKLNIPKTFTTRIRGK